MPIIIPKEVTNIIKKLQGGGFKAYAVGGCVRDFLLGIEPKDWDVATNAKPNEIQRIFPKSFYENKFGTVTVLIDETEVQVTTYRVDVSYSDKRHPDSVKFTASLKEDLARRDFTINAMALDLETYNMKHETQEDKSFKFQVSRFKVIDPFNGQEDLKNKIIRAVGNPDERFAEDALRLMRAIRFACQLNFLINKETMEAIRKFSSLISYISKERVRDELGKMIMTNSADKGIELMRETELLQQILPEVLEGYSVSQDKHHIYDVYEHSVRSLKYAVEQDFNFHVRMTALFHDVGKPRTKRGERPNATFYGHDVVGAQMTRKIMERLKFPKHDVELVALLVRYHLFYYNVDEVTPASVRRLVKNVGLENMNDLINLRMADRIGSGVPKAEPYKLRHFRYMVDKVSKDPISVKMLKVDGNDVMRILNIQPGPKVGIILNALLSEVLDDPERNNKEHLEERIRKLGNFPISELSEMIRKAEEKIEILESEHKKQFRV